MSFIRDYGYMCVIIPLKFGVAIIAMYAFVMGIINLLAMLNSNIMLQAGGYNPAFKMVGTVIAVIGLPVGLVGLIGTYDDNARWVRVFFYYLLVKIVGEIVVAVADFVTLNHCKGYIDTNLPNLLKNDPLKALSERDVCGSARTAYALGFTLEMILNIYLTYCVWVFIRHLDLLPNYPIDFYNADRFKNMYNRWKMFHVDEVPFYSQQIEEATGNVPTLQEQVAAGYGSFQEKSGDFFDRFKQAIQGERVEEEVQEGQPYAQEMQTPRRP